MLCSSPSNTPEKDVSYPTLDLDAQSIVPETLDSFKDHNKSSMPRRWSFAGSKDETVSYSWS
ncbi:MAG: hypothetical protein ACRD22_18795, partial [Terriglobia bacterium]